MLKSTMDCGDPLEVARLVASFGGRIRHDIGSGEPIVEIEFARGRKEVLLKNFLAGMRRQSSLGDALARQTVLAMELKVRP